MRYYDLLLTSGAVPVVESSTLRASGHDPRTLGVQLSRWVKAGKLVQLRRGCYLLPEALRRTAAPLEAIANALVRPSYVSLEYALGSHEPGLDPPPVVQSVTTGRPGRFVTPVGTFEYRHVKVDWFFGYAEREVANVKTLVATPEKALLDLLYLSTGPLSEARLRELPLGALEPLDRAELAAMAARARSPRLERAVKKLAKLLAPEQRRGPVFA